MHHPGGGSIASRATKLKHKKSKEEKHSSKNHGRNERQRLCGENVGWMGRWGRKYHTIYYYMWTLIQIENQFSSYFQFSSFASSFKLEITAHTQREKFFPYSANNITRKMRRKKSKRFFFVKLPPLYPEGIVRQLCKPLSFPPPFRTLQIFKNTLLCRRRSLPRRKGLWHDKRDPTWIRFRRRIGLGENSCNVTDASISSVKVMAFDEISPGAKLYAFFRLDGSG